MSTDLLLWLDLETTGLDPENLTVLEFAWTVTDDTLTQLTPLRSRLSALTQPMKLWPYKKFGVLFDSWFAADPITPTLPHEGDLSGWSGQIDPFVADMHDLSGLHKEWLASYAIDSVSHFDDLIVADLERCGWSPTMGMTVYLAGAGVSHFDRLVLDKLRSRLANPVGSGKPVLHYRAADVSPVFTILGIPAPKSTLDLDAMILDAQDRSASAVESDALTELVTASSTEHLTSDAGYLATQNIRQHRAADDVAFALVSARCLRKSVISSEVEEIPL